MKIRIVRTEVKRYVTVVDVDDSEAENLITSTKGPNSDRLWELCPDLPCNLLDEAAALYDVHPTANGTD